LYIKIYYIDHALAITSDARVFSRLEFVPIAARGYAGGRNQLFGIHMGKITASDNNKKI